MKVRIIVLVLLCTLGCGNEEIPPETQDGENTFGMLVDGVPWQPYNPGLFSPGNKRPSIYYYSSSGLIVVIAQDSERDEVLEFAVDSVEDVGLYEANPNLFSAVSDTLNYGCQDSTRFEYNWDCKGSFKLNDAVNSMIAITRIDTLEKIVSGTFEMELITDSNDTMRIANGVFDSEFIVFE